MDNQKIDTRLVYGFLEAGKTYFIQDCILQDYFHKYGTTLILCFEQGEQEYDTEILLKKKATVVYYDDEEDISSFCRQKIEEHQPDRIYVEMNIMIPGLRNLLPDIMNVTYVTTRIDWTTLSLYIINFRQMINQMVSESHQVTFRNCPSRELLAPYSQDFRLMNHRATYLRQDSMGYHEKAFDLFVPFSLDNQIIEINGNGYLPLWLDAVDHPEHYEGKILVFTNPVELRCDDKNKLWSIGRIVMICCMSDLQFMRFELTEEDPSLLNAGWIRLKAQALIGIAEYGRKVLKLKLICTEPVKAPDELILSSISS